MLCLRVGRIKFFVLRYEVCKIGTLYKVEDLILMFYTYERTERVFKMPYEIKMLHTATCMNTCTARADTHTSRLHAATDNSLRGVANS